MRRKKTINPRLKRFEKVNVSKRFEKKLTMFFSVAHLSFVADPAEGKGEDPAVDVGGGVLPAEVKKLCYRR